MVGPEPVADPPDPLRRLARLQRLGAAEVIERTARMGLDVAQGLGLDGQVVQRQRQKRVLVDIGEVPGVIGVLVGEHAPSCPAPLPSSTLRDGR
jgi:hypothetical protein